MQYASEGPTHLRNYMIRVSIKFHLQNQKLAKNEVPARCTVSTYTIGTIGITALDNNDNIDQQNVHRFGRKTTAR